MIVTEQNEKTVALPLRRRVPVADLATAMAERSHRGNNKFYNHPDVNNYS